MDTAWNEKLWKRTIHQLWDRGIEEESFRQYCEEHPHEAIEKISGLPLPEEVKIRIDASADAASYPSYRDVFQRRVGGVIQMPQTKTLVSVTAN